jgi:3-oxoacyl-[acyl-carrier-protein] synthase II
MTGRRVVITGIGIVSPVGIGNESFWKNLIDGVSGVDRSPKLINADCRCKVAGEVKDFQPEKWLDRKDVKRSDRFSQLGVVGAMLAAQDAGLVLENEDPERMGVSVGTAYAGWLFATKEYGAYIEHGAEAVSPYTGTAVFTGSCGGQIALHLGLRAPSITISTGCDCSTAAAAHSADLIVNSVADVMFSGGAEAPVHPPIIAALDASYAMTHRNAEPLKASRPFDAKRDGFIMAEGSCVMVLEELQHARRRGARIYAELVGWGSTCDAYHMCEPAPDGAQGARALRLALTQAGVRPEEVDYINAHGTSTVRGDQAETLVIKKVFGEHAYRVPISSIKSSMGHMQGACGSAEMAACCFAIRDNVLPPTLNYEYADPGCDLDYVPNKARRHQVEIAASNSFSFGGRNTAVIMRRYRDGNNSQSGENGNGARHAKGTVQS